MKKSVCKPNKNTEPQVGSQKSTHRAISGQENDDDDETTDNSEDNNKQEENTCKWKANNNNNKQQQQWNQDKRKKNTVNNCHMNLHLNEASSMTESSGSQWTVFIQND